MREVVLLRAREAPRHLGFLAPLYALDAPASDAITRQRLDFCPVEPELLADLEGDAYFRAQKID